MKKHILFLFKIMYINYCNPLVLGLQGVYVALIGVYMAYFVAAMVITHEKKVKDPTPLIIVTAVTTTFITIWLVRKHFGKQIQEKLVFHVVFFFEQREKMVKALKM